MPINVKIGADTSAFKTGLAEIENRVTGFASRIGGIMVGAFGFEAIRQGISSAIAMGDSLQDISEKFGVSASKLQMLGNAASVYGSSLENISAGLNKLSLAQQKAISGDEGLRKTFNEVGVSLQDLSSMSVDDIFLKISDSFASGANDGRQFVIVNELLGKAQTDLIKVMNQGSAAIIDQGNSMGVWSDETIAALSAASDALKTLQNQFTIFFGNLAMGIESAVQRYQDFIEAVVLAGKARFSSGIDASSRATLMEQSSAKVGDVIFGRSAMQEQPSTLAKNAGQNDLNERIREREKDDQDYVRFRVRLIDKEIEGRNSAQKILDQYEDKANQERIRNAEQRGRATSEAMARIEDIRAEKSGAKAEQDLLIKRAKSAAETARQTNTAQDTLIAEQLSLSLKKSIEQSLIKRGYDPETVSSAALKYTQDITGKLPELKQPSISDINAAPLDAETFKVTSESVVEKYLSGIKDIAATLRDTANIPAVTVQPDQVLNGSVDECKATVKGCLDKLDAILRVSGTFGM